MHFWYSESVCLFVCFMNQRTIIADAAIHNSYKNCQFWWVYSGIEYTFCWLQVRNSDVLLIGKKKIVWCWDSLFWFTFKTLWIWKFCMNIDIIYTKLVHFSSTKSLTHSYSNINTNYPKLLASTKLLASEHGYYIHRCKGLMSYIVLILMNAN